MAKGQTGGVIIGKEKCWTIMYADDVILLIENMRDADMREMLKRFKRFIQKKGLNLSPEKSKIMVFEKGRSRIKKREWK